MPSTREDHPADARLEEALREEDRSPEAREHLEEGCVRCVTRASERLRTGSMLDAGVRAWIRRTYGGTQQPNADALTRTIGGEVAAWARMVRYEEAVGPALLETLLTLPSPARRSAIRSRGQYRTLGFARHLTARARQEVFVDLGRAAELGELAVEVAERLEESGYSRGQAGDAGALAWGALANAHRVASDLPRADRGLRQARIVARDGSGDPLVEAELLSLEGSLRISQARFDEARSVLEEAVVLLGRHGEPGAEARVVAQLAKALGDDGRPEEAVVVLARAEELLSAEDDGRLYAYVLHSRAAYLSESGQAEEARELLERLKPLWPHHAPGVANELRLLWLEARICWSGGDRVGAEEKLVRVRDGWEQRGDLYEVALVSLDLGALLLEQGRTREVKDLAERMLPIFKSQDVHRHAVAALVLVQRSVEAEKATVAIFQDVARYLRRARHNPLLTYSPLK